VFRTEKRRNPVTGATYPWIVRSTGVVNQFYIYCVDGDFGPFFLKFCSYFPYNAKLCINGHEWAKRQAAKAGIGFEALDNGFAAVEDPVAVQGICDRLSTVRIDRLLRKWLAILPHPFTRADRAAGYRYDISVLQAEFSLTQMLDRPLTGRVFFEEVIRENLDIGRPDHVGLVFDRRIRSCGRHPTPGRFRTRVLTRGVTPSLHVDYKHSKIKQYHKDGRALRTETTINDTGDFGIGPPRGVHHLPVRDAAGRVPAPRPRRHRAGHRRREGLGPGPPAVGRLPGQCRLGHPVGDRAQPDPRRRSPGLALSRQGDDRDHPGAPDQRPRPPGPRRPPPHPAPTRTWPWQDAFEHLHAAVHRPPPRTA
jgi:hypothetical protein